MLFPGIRVTAENVKKTDTRDNNCQVYLCRTRCLVDDDLDWVKLQNEDPILAVLIKGQERNRGPLHQEISPFGSEMKSYLLYWVSLELTGETLFRR